MSFIIIIPARFASTRLPGKPLIDINGKPMIVHMLERAHETGAKRVIVATDHDDIARIIKLTGGDVCMTSSHHQSGTERLAEVVEKYSFSDETIIVNIQCDEPMIHAGIIRQIVDNLIKLKSEIVTLAVPIRYKNDFFNQNTVKVVINAHRYALYFSRSPIPWDYNRFFTSKNVNNDVFLCHRGIYGYRARFIRRYISWVPSPLEDIETLEQLRVLWYGEKIYVVVTEKVIGTEVNTPEDLKIVRTMLS